MQIKKKLNVSIKHPHDWVILTRQCGKANPIKVIEMTIHFFFFFQIVRKITKGKNQLVSNKGVTVQKKRNHNVYYIKMS